MIQIGRGVYKTAVVQIGGVYETAVVQIGVCTRQ